MKLEKEFNEYLADMAVLSIKISNLHWNVVGKNFLAVHKYTEAEYEKAQERMDEVAELIRMFGLVPASTMAEYLQLAHVKEVPSKQYTCAEVLDTLLSDLELVRKVATDLRNAADKEGWFSAVDLLEDHVNDFNKQIWMIKAMLTE